MNPSEKSAGTPEPRRTIAIWALLSLFGLLFHNWWDLPDLSWANLENSAPAVVFVVIGVAWWQRPRSTITLTVLLIWGIVHLIGGGIMSVIPFDFLPFYPEQSLRHYAGHLVYIATQMPLIFVTFRELRGVRRAGAER